jgi:hypothetical protein
MMLVPVPSHAAYVDVLDPLVGLRDAPGVFWSHRWPCCFLLSVDVCARVQTFLGAPLQ